MKEKQIITERINKLMAYLPHLTREQAEKHIKIEIELEKKEKKKFKSIKRAMGIRF